MGRLLLRVGEIKYDCFVQRVQLLAIERIALLIQASYGTRRHRSDRSRFELGRKHTLFPVESQRSDGVNDGAGQKARNI